MVLGIQIMPYLRVYLNQIISLSQALLASIDINLPIFLLSLALLYLVMLWG